MGNKDNLEIQMIPDHLTGLNCKMCCVSAGAGKNLLRKYGADEKGLFLFFEWILIEVNLWRDLQDAASFEVKNSSWWTTLEKRGLSEGRMSVHQGSGRFKCLPNSLISYKRSFHLFGQILEDILGLWEQFCAWFDLPAPCCRVFTRPSAAQMAQV